MMFAASLPLALLALAAGSSAPVNRSAKPVVIHIKPEANVPKAVVQIARGETDAIFRSAGVTFDWCEGDPDVAAASLVVVIGNQEGPQRQVGTPLGWLVFENGAPMPTLYLSYANAQRYFSDSREVVGPVAQKTVAERELLMGRLMGRALAHELGHYLIGTKEHTDRGLLKRAPTAAQFFSPDRSPFSIGAAERAAIMARLTSEANLTAANRAQAPSPGQATPSRTPVVPQPQR